MRLEGVNPAFVDGTGLMQAAVQMLIKFIKGKIDCGRVCQKYQELCAFKG